MDALAGYGSDDSSSCNSVPAPAAAPAAASVAHDNRNNNNSEAAKPYSMSDEQQQNPPRNRKRRWDNGGGTSNPPSLSSQRLPPPSLSSTTTGQQQSMIEWEVDYLAQYHPAKIVPESATESSQKFLANRLKLTQVVNPFQVNDNNSTQTQAKEDSTTTNQQRGWAVRLKGQHDFHNPRFLDNVATQCGITSMMGSNNEGNESFEDYEFNLIELEEKARVQAFRPTEEQDHALFQQQQQQQQNDASLSSQFAQDQLERAMQQQCQR